MRDGVACSRGLVGEGTFDYFGDDGRVRAKSMYVVARPARLRFDVLSPLGGVLSTLTSDGERFAFYDLRQRVFLQGPAEECNVEQALKVPVPPRGARPAPDGSGSHPRAPAGASPAGLGGR